MSFPRAKIQRFNETPSCSPAPGTYDPKLDTNVKGPVLRKDSKQTPEGEGCTKQMPVVLPVFRTPQLPRKVFKIGTGGKSQGRERTESTSSLDDLIKGKETGTFTEDLTELGSLKQRLKETIEELNKSKELCELSNSNFSEKVRQIEELQHRNKTLTDEIEALQHRLAEAHSKHQCSLSEFEVLDGQTLSHLQEIHSMVDELIDKENILFKERLKLRDELDDLASLKCDLEQKVAQKQQMILLLQSELSSAEVELVECRSECERQSAIACERTQEVETLKVTIQNLERNAEETDKTLRHMRDNLMNGSVVRENLEEQLNEKEAAYLDLETNYSQLISDFESLKEKQSSEISQIIQIYDEQLVSIKGDFELASELVHTQTSNLQIACNKKMHFLEEKIASNIAKSQEIWQKEVVNLKKELKKSAEHLKNEQIIAHEKIESLIKENDKRDQESIKRIKDVESEARIITEKLLRAEEELRRTNDLKEELKISNVENQITIVELQDKVDLLTVEKDSYNTMLSEVKKEQDSLKSQNKKLAVGNRNLNDSLQALRVRLLESESDVEEMSALKSSLEADKKMLELALESKLQELEDHKTNVAKIQAENLREIEQIREHLMEQLELFKQKALLSAEQLQKSETLKNKEIQDLSIQLESFRQQLENLKKYVDTMEEENDKQTLQLQNYEEQLKQHEESCAKLSAKCEQQAIKLQQCSEELAVAQGKIDLQENQDMEYKQHIEQLTADVQYYETRISELNEALGVMEDSNVDREKEIEALTEKLDHQQDCAKVATQQIASLEATKSYQEHQIQSLNLELERHTEFSHQATEHMLSLVNSNTEKERQIVVLNEEIEDLKNLNKKLMDELEDLNIKQKEELDNVNKIASLQNLLQCQESDMKRLNEACEKYQTQIGNLRAQNMEQTLMAKKNETDNISVISKLKEEIKKLELENLRLRRMEEKAGEWEQKFHKMESLIGPFKEQLEAYSAECKMLETEKGEVQKHMRELAVQYATALGHQNHKQKIRYMVKIKDENIELREEVRNLKRTIDKLRKDMSSNNSKSTNMNHTTHKGKENIQSVSHSPVQKSPVASTTPKPFADRSAQKNVF